MQFMTDFVNYYIIVMKEGEHMIIKGKEIKKWMIGIVAVVLLTIISVAIYYMTLPDIEFVTKSPQVELHKAFDANKNIKKVRNGKVKEVSIDTSKIDIEKLGKYPVTYTYHKSKYTMQVQVVDTVAPTFDIKDMEIDLGMSVEPKDMVSNVKDDTSTQIDFKQKYDFTKEGKHKVIVQVKDESNNITEKEAMITVVKDSEKPILEGVNDISVRVNGKIDYLQGIVAKDNRDSKPKVEVDDSKVNLQVAGSYIAKYTVTDRSGNKNVIERKVIVEEQKEIGSSQQSGDKVVYLTFDDGPSANTAKILDILDRYQAKATFFVTGNGQDYNYLITEANKRGHTIGLHTFSHDYASVYASPVAYFNDLDRVGSMVEGLIGYRPRYIRFPGGSSNTVSRHYYSKIMSILSSQVIEKGYQYYDWNASTGDAGGNNVPVTTLISGGTLSNANNIMILAHDTNAKNTTVEALPAIIEHYQKLGYRFEGISDNSFAPHQGINN